MRGNRQSRLEEGQSRRSIPAYAGEPALRRAGYWLGKVYPRVCGGTGSGIRLGDGREGLSPRMRGNLFYPTRAKMTSGSIPAYAGEPRIATGKSTADRVYPRVCGGTSEGRQSGYAGTGLSPRMRGNLESDMATAGV